MNTRISAYTLSVFIFAGFVFSPTPPADGAVLFFDTIAGLNQPVRLTVLTRGKILARGGQRVDIFLDRTRIAGILTGGDGYGYFKYIPRKTGRLTIDVRSSGEKGSGILLVVDPSVSALFVDVETCLAKTLFSPKTTAGMKQALTALGEKYRLVYLTRFLGISLTRILLAKSALPESVVLRWQGAATLDELKQTGLRLHAMIASAEMLAEAAEYIENRYAFEDTEAGTPVDDWDALMKRLYP